MSAPPTAEEGDDNFDPDDPDAQDGDEGDEGDPDEGDDGNGDPEGDDAPPARDPVRKSVGGRGYAVIDSERAIETLRKGIGQDAREGAAAGFEDLCNDALADNQHPLARILRKSVRQVFAGATLAKAIATAQAPLLELSRSTVDYLGSVQESLEDMEDRQETEFADMRKALGGGVAPGTPAAPSTPAVTDLAKAVDGAVTPAVQNLAPDPNAQAEEILNKSLGGGQPTPQAPAGTVDMGRLGTLMREAEGLQEKTGRVVPGLTDAIAGASTRSASPETIAQLEKGITEIKKSLG